MTWSKDALFERADGLRVELVRAGRLTIVCHEGTVEGSRYTLRVLDAFAAPVTVQDALAALQPLLPGFAAFTEVMREIQNLINRGVIRETHGEKAIVPLEPDEGRFDAFPVHVRMLDDVARTRAFQDAIRRTVRPDDVVLEIGTGTGILAATAAAAGARHVYAIERTPFASIARQVMAANGLADRVTVMEASSLDVELPEKATVLVCELVGDDPLVEGMRRTMLDAAQRHLHANARILPERIRLMAQPLAVPRDRIERNVVTESLAAKWSAHYGLDLSPLAEQCRAQDHVLHCNSFATRAWPRPGPAFELVDLDLRGAQERNLSVQRSFLADPGGELSGILVYFELLLGAAGWFSTAPDRANETNHWHSPVWLPGTPITLAKGQRCELVFDIARNKSRISLAAPTP